MSMKTQIRTRHYFWLTGVHMVTESGINFYRKKSDRESSKIKVTICKKTGQFEEIQLNDGGVFSLQY